MGLSEVDLLKDHENILIDDKYSKLNVNIEIPRDAKWVGNCKQCMLNFVPPLFSSIDDLGHASCPKCGSQEINWRVNKKALINQTTLQKRIPDVFRKRILGWENQGQTHGQKTSG